MSIDELFASLANASASAAELLQRSAALPTSVRLGGVGRLAASGSLAKVEFSGIVAVIEAALSRGDQATQDAVATGFIEAMVNSGGNASSLGPLAQKYCAALEALFGDGSR
ncbi:MAG: hypothetical protein GQE15_17750 [Archangiaceae bacterium]|nr:hypothetical protein [Archangiaceae bacterium]